MTSIENQLEKIKKENRLGLMTHVVIGYPTLGDTVKLVKTMAEAGVDFVELQIPFSDPVADGPVIMHASDVALRQGTTVHDTFAIMKELSQTVDIPLLFMGYYNSVFSYGVERFIKTAISCGCAGLIIPDIPPEEEDEENFIKLCNEYKLHHIRVLSPASTDERIQKNARLANGFVYLVSRYGTTGTKKDLDPRLKQNIERVKKYVDVPLAVGFGISNKEHVNALRGQADIANIGSAIIDIIDLHQAKDFTRYVAQFIQGLLS